MWTIHLPSVGGNSRISPKAYFPKHVSFLKTYFVEAYFKISLISGISLFQKKQNQRRFSLFRFENDHVPQLHSHFSFKYGTMFCRSIGCGCKRPSGSMLLRSRYQLPLRGLFPIYPAAQKAGKFIGNLVLISANGSINSLCRSTQKSEGFLRTPMAPFDHLYTKSFWKNGTGFLQQLPSSIASWEILCPVAGKFWILGVPPASAQSSCFLPLVQVQDKLILMQSWISTPSWSSNAHRNFCEAWIWNYAASSSIEEQAWSLRSLLQLCDMVPRCENPQLTLIANAQKILDAVSFPHISKRSKNRRDILGRIGRIRYLRQEAFKVRLIAYPNYHSTITQRIEKELELHPTEVFYLLLPDQLQTSWLLRQERNFLSCSAGVQVQIALVALLSGNHRCGPIELRLILRAFYQFYIRENPPDFDIDFSWDRSGDAELIAYIFQKYNQSGHEHVCAAGISYTPSKPTSMFAETRKSLWSPKKVEIEFRWSLCR